MPGSNRCGACYSAATMNSMCSQGQNHAETVASSTLMRGPLGCRPRGFQQAKAEVAGKTDVCLSYSAL